MRVLVVGSGGREHAIMEKLLESAQVEELFAAPGNAGTGRHNVPIAANDIDGLVRFAREKKIDLVVPGPELPLTLGITDAMAEIGVPCFGPDAWASQLEGSKTFAKEIMTAAGVPTAAYTEFDDLDAARAHIRAAGAPIVIKADGLAAGKGVVVAETLPEALAACEHLFPLSGKLVIEEKLEGEEVSLLCLCDGENYLPLPSAQDHKAAYDGDQGPNTGGMGAYSPAPALPDEKLAEMADLVVEPVLREMARRGHPFRGVLYAGLMLTADGPKVLEYNVRFGDPECQVILPRLKSDLAELLLGCAKGSIAVERPLFDSRPAVGVVLAAGNYPGDYPKGLPLDGLDGAASENVLIFHSGTLEKDGAIVSNGGRVLCVTALGDTLAKARGEAYAAMGKIRMPLGRYRQDIADKGLARLERNRDN